MSKIFKEIPIDSVKAEPMEKHWIIDEIKKLEIKDIDNDIIVMTFDIDEYSFDEAVQTFQSIKKQFPNHNLIGTVKGVELSVESIDSMIAQLEEMKK
jgi:hypothetical protein